MATLKPIGVKIDTSDLKALKQIAADEERSVGFLIRQAIKRYLEKKTDAAILKLTDKIVPLEKVLKKVPERHRFSSPSAFIAAWDRWYEELNKAKGVKQK